MTYKEKVTKLIELLEELDSFASINFVDISEDDKRGSKGARELIVKTVDSLKRLSVMLDPIAQPEIVFDPSDPKMIGKLIAQTLLEQTRVPITRISRFYGSGVYAIYYNGPFEAYAKISGKDHPLYVGKADPADNDAQTVEEQGDRLFRRLKDHLRSLSKANNLDENDFDCRYLVVKSAWQKTAEDYLISLFQPVWNNEVNICYGLGKHGDSSNTRKNTRSPWDTIHPGREWAWTANTVPNPQSPDEIISKIIKHLHNTF